MSVVRELVTKLSFSFDRTNLEKAEKSIIGFKTKAAISFGLIAKSIERVFDFTSNISESAIATKDLADYAGIAVDRFVALRNATSKLNLNPESFNAGISKLSILLKEASRGGGELFKILQETKHAINFRKENGDLKNTEELLRNIFEAVPKIQTRSEQLRILGNIFDPESAGAWLRIIEKAPGEFDKLIEKEREFGKAFESSLPSFQQFNQDLGDLRNEWEKLYFSIAKEIVPVLNKAVKGTTDFVEFHKEQPKFEQSFIEEAAKDAGTKLFGGEGYLDKLQREIKEDKEEFIKNFNKEKERISNTKNIDITNNNSFEFNMAPGSTEQQAHDISQVVNKTLQDIMDAHARQIINNNPTVE